MIQLKNSGMFHKILKIFTDGIKFWRIKSTTFIFIVSKFLRLLCNEILFIFQ